MGKKNEEDEQAQWMDNNITREKQVMVLFNSWKNKCINIKTCVNIETYLNWTIISEILLNIIKSWLTCSMLASLHN